MNPGNRPARRPVMTDAERLRLYGPLRPMQDPDIFEGLFAWLLRKVMR